MTVEEIDKAAQSRTVIEEYSLIEYGLYSRLKDIYDAYDRKTIPLNAAKEMKDEAIKEFEQWQFCYNDYHAEALKRATIGILMSEASKNGCSICRKVAKIYDGREQIKA